MREYRLRDTLEDYCVKCKRITNHNIVSVVNENPAKVRCCSCYNDHDYRHEIAPPTKKELKKAALLEELLAGKGGADAEAEEVELDEETSMEEFALPIPEQADADPPKATRKSKS